MGSAFRNPGDRVVPHDPGEPQYHSDGRAAPRSLSLRSTDTTDAIVLLLAGMLSIWFATLCLIELANGRLTRLLLLIPFWLILSYIALPRIHQVLSRLYLPDYYIGRTSTPIGILGDPVNVAFLGTRDDVRAALTRAGWREAVALDTTSSLHMIWATLMRRPFPDAPVSTLELFDRPEDLAFQRAVGRTTSKRHHIRLWRAPEDWRLPGGGRVDWLAATSFDRAIGFSLFTMQVTHKIDTDVDAERDYTIAMLEYVDPDISVSWDDDLGTGFHARNGGGDRVVTDGRVAVVDAHGSAGRLPTPLAPAEQRPSGRGFPPIPLLVAIAILGARWLLVLIDLVMRTGSGRPPMLFPGIDLPLAPAGIVLLDVVGLLVLIAALVALLRHRSWARLLLIIASLADAVIQLRAASLELGAQTHFVLSSAMLSLLVVVTLTSGSVSAWTERREPGAH